MCVLVYCQQVTPYRYLRKIMDLKNIVAVERPLGISGVKCELGLLLIILYI